MHGLETIRQMNETNAEVKSLERLVAQLRLNERFLLQAIDEIHANICPGQDGTWQQRAQQAVKESKDIAWMLKERRRLAEYARVEREFGNEC